MSRTLAVVAKDNFDLSRPWTVIIYGDKDRGIRSGKQGPWKSMKAAQAWADGFNKLNGEYHG